MKKLFTLLALGISSVFYIAWNYTRQVGENRENDDDLNMWL